MSETAKVENLWGNLPVEDVRTPHVILREQASILTKATDGLLVGKVIKEKFKNIQLPSSGLIGHLKTSVSQETQDKYSFISRLEITVPSINNYSISIVQIDYPLKMYPLRIRSSITDEYQYKECQTESEFNERLAKILSSADVKRIIAGLLTEIRADAKQDIEVDRES